MKMITSARLRALAILAPILLSCAARGAANDLDTAPLELASDRIDLQPGQSVSLGISGGEPPYSIEYVDPAVVQASVEGRTLFLTGVDAGSSRVPVVDSVGHEAALIAAVSDPRPYPVTGRLGEIPWIGTDTESELAPITLTEKSVNSLRDGYFRFYARTSGETDIQFTSATISGGGPETRVQPASAPQSSFTTGVSNALLIYLDADDSRIDSITIHPTVRVNTSSATATVSVQIVDGNGLGQLTGIGNSVGDWITLGRFVRDLSLVQGAAVGAGASSARFALGASDDAGSSYSSTLLSRPGNLVVGQIQPAREHLGLPAAFFVAVRFTAPTGAGGWYYRTEDRRFLPWNRQLHDLEAAAEAGALMQTHKLEIFSGKLPPGDYEVYLGYLASGEPLVYSSEPLRFNTAAD